MPEHPSGQPPYLWDTQNADFRRSGSRHHAYWQDDDNFAPMRASYPQNPQNVYITDRPRAAEMPQNNQDWESRLPPHTPSSIGQVHKIGRHAEMRHQGYSAPYQDEHAVNQSAFGSRRDSIGYPGRPMSTNWDYMDPYSEPNPGPRTTSSAFSMQHHTPERPMWEPEYPSFLDTMDGPEMMTEEQGTKRKVLDKPHYSQRRTNRDEFDGPVQFLKKPSYERVAAQDKDLPHVPINLDAREQDDVLRQVNAQLSQCAFDFVAKYQFPIPLEPDKRPVEKANDREWTEWAYLIKRLATKRRIPSRVLYNGQIKQLVTVLENSLEMRHASAHQSRPPKDDRNVLQLISAGTQVAKILKDAVTMECLDRLYQQTERLIQKRRQASLPLGS